MLLGRHAAAPSVAKFVSIVSRSDPAAYARDRARSVAAIPGTTRSGPRKGHCSCEAPFGLMREGATPQLRKLADIS